MHRAKESEHLIPLFNIKRLSTSHEQAYGHHFSATGCRLHIYCDSGALDEHMGYGPGEERGLNYVWIANDHTIDLISSRVPLENSCLMDSVWCSLRGSCAYIQTQPAMLGYTHSSAIVSALRRGARTSPRACQDARGTRRQPPRGGFANSSAV